MKQWCRFLLVSLILSGCASPSKNMQTSFFASTAADSRFKSICTNNAFLKKYDCSVNRIKDDANTGNPDAQYALGYLYFYGLGVPKNLQTARQWIQKAASQGQQLASRALSLMPSVSSVTASAVPGGSDADASGSTRVTRVAQPLTAVQGSAQAGASALVKNTGPYAIQLMSSNDLSSLRAYVKSLKLPLFTSSGVEIYSKLGGSKAGYVLLAGSFSSIEAARAAIKTLPEAVQKQKPWVRSVSQLTLVQGKV